MKTKKTSDRNMTIEIAIQNINRERYTYEENKVTYTIIYKYIYIHILKDVYILFIYIIHSIILNCLYR